MHNLEVVLHCGAVGTAEAAGDEEEKHQGWGHPAAGQDPVLDISRSAREHAVLVNKALERMKGGGSDLEILERQQTINLGNIFVFKRK